MFRKNLSFLVFVFPVFFFACTPTTHIVNLNETQSFYVKGRVKAFTEIVFSKVIDNNKPSNSTVLTYKRYLEFSKEGKILHEEKFFHGHDNYIFTYRYGKDGKLNHVAQKVNGKIISEYKVTYDGHLRKREEWIKIANPNNSKGTTFHYDENGELIRKYYFFLNSLKPISETFYEYNENGQISSMVVHHLGWKYEKEEQVYKYDRKGRVIFLQKTEINLKDTSDVNIRKEYTKYKISGRVKRQIFSKYGKDKRCYNQLSLKNKQGHPVKLQRFRISESDFESETSDNPETWLLSDTEAVYQYEFDKYGNWSQLMTIDPIIKPPSLTTRTFIYYE